ncbi:MAG: DEAD/DEAH box helicase, partial [Anaerolineae bacterium]|nr:DEAD/DEAH box helicase [Anaerolineae bacterium]
MNVSDFNEFNLDERLMRAVAESGYEQPTPIQAEAIPVVMSGADLIGTAQTGTGKTAAFVLPILQRILQTPLPQAAPAEAPKPRSKAKSQQSHHRALIVTPTRELAEQINDTIKVLGKYTEIRSETIYGGVASRPQEKALKDGVEILVACPGRLLDHIDAGLCKLDKIDVLVLDEADRMFDMGFLPSVRRILEFVNRQRQTLLFSATFPREVEELASSTLRNPERVAIGMPQAAETITHALYPVPLHLKKKLLIALLRQTDAYAMLVFTRTKHRAEALARQLGREGFKTTSLHSDRSQNQRQAALNGFKAGKYQIMVATDIAARGLDVETISHVINYDIPDTVDAYVHR